MGEDNPNLSIAKKAVDVLKNNDQGLYTAPSREIYPQQWLWDSCFIAIGLRHLDVERAKMEILSILRGQWSNGMIPHMIVSTDMSGKKHASDIWQSWVSPLTPEDVATSGITQPPMLAEAIVKIGDKLPIVERRSWYKQVWPNLLAYHQWLYAERDPHHEGLTLQIHPWETGLDNTPPWMAELHEHILPWWIRLLRNIKAEKLLNFARNDTRRVPADQRHTNIDGLALYDTVRRLRRKNYEINKILDHSLFAIEDVAFNSIFIRANEHLQEISKTIRLELPEELHQNIAKTKKAFAELWDPYTEQYYSRNFITHRLIKEPSIESLIPLYSGAISKERAALLVRSLENEHLFGPAFPVPSVPINSPWFDQKRYWQGPTWLNTNWLIADGLRRYGYHHHANALIESSQELVKDGHFNEYFNPLTGEPLGAPNFSWTAALIIDWLDAKN